MTLINIDGGSLNNIPHYTDAQTKRIQQSPLLLILLIWLLVVSSSAFANHTESDICPDTHVYGGESLTPQFIDATTGAPIWDGMTITNDASLTVNLDMIATADGYCDINIYEIPEGCVYQGTLERDVIGVGRRHYRNWNGSYYELPLPSSTPIDPATGQATQVYYYDTRVDSTPTISTGLGLGVNYFTIWNAIDRTSCEIDPGVIFDTVTINVRDPQDDKNLGCNIASSAEAVVADAAGNPCNVATGNEFLREADLAGNGDSLKFVRYYNSQLDIDSGLGPGWTSTFHKRLDRYGDTTRVQQSSGRAETFTYTGSLWQGEADSKLVLTEDANGYTLKLPDDSSETYDTTGRLLTITYPNGRIQNLNYDGDGDLQSVVTNTGELLSFTYTTDKNVETLTEDRSGRVWTYRYDASLIQNLEYVDNPDGTTRQYHYEDATRPNALTGITDERGIRYATFAYDANGRVTDNYHGPQTSVLTDRIEGITITYNANGTRILTNSNSNSSTYSTVTHLGVSHVTGITGPGCVTCGPANSSYDYDPTNNNLRSVTDNGIITEYGNHNANGNPGYRIEAKGTSEERRTDYTYDSRYFGKVATQTEPSVQPGSSKVTTYGYDDFGNRISETTNGFTPSGTPVSRTTTWQYNGPLHQLSQIDGPRTGVSDVSSFRYYPDDPLEGNNRARLKEVEDANGVLVRSNIQYTATGKVASEVRPNGLSLIYTYYPGNDRLETLTESDGTTSRVTRWSYLETGEVQTITTADGSTAATTVTFGYDAARRLTRITDGLGNYIEYTLDTEGNRLGENTYDSGGALIKSLAQTFDIYNRLDTTSQANEGMDYDYAPDGTLSQNADGKSSVTDFDYDNLKRLVTSTQDLGGLNAQTIYDYDVSDRLTSVTDPVDGNTEYIYDDLGNLLTTTSPDTGTTTYSYDAAGNLESRQDAKGQLFLYSYDALNRLTGVDAPGTDDDITYSYDVCTNGTGRLCGVTTATNSVTFDYDAFGNVVQHQAVTYTYDAANRVRTMTYPSGAVVTYNYDAAGQASQVDLMADGSTTTLASAINYVPFGDIETLTFGNGANLSQSWDTAYRLTAQSAPGILDLGYPLYDANGNLESRTDAYFGPGSFAYDALNRLDTASGPFGSNWDYDYDLNGNRTLGNEGTSINLVYEPNSNRLATEANWSYTLDANGNTTERLDSEEAGRLYGYNSHNRLASVADRTVTPGHGNKPPTIEDTEIVSYSYNGLGQRISKTLADGTVSQFVYGTDGALLAELDGSGAVQREYVYLNGELLAMLDQVESGGSGGGDVILDDGDAGTSSTGSWAANTSNKANENDYLLAAGGTGSTYRWTPGLAAGTYDVEVWYVKHQTHSVAPYTISHAGQTTNATLDQSVGGNAWYPIATGITFDGSGAEYVEVSDANGKTTADAVRFVYTGGSGSGTVTAVYYVHNDHLGTPQAMTDAAGTVIWRASYDPFGRATVDDDPDGDSKPSTLNVRFPGQYYDSETGLHYNYFRYYDPETDRYITADPIGLLGGINPYIYANANPLRWFDAYGLEAATGTLPRAGSGVSIPPWARNPAGFAAWASMFSSPVGEGSDVVPDNATDKPEQCDNEDECQEKFIECLGTSLNDGVGGNFGHNRCLLCRDACVQNSGTWPRFAHTGDRCDYWNLK